MGLYFNFKNLNKEIVIKKKEELVQACLGPSAVGEVSGAKLHGTLHLLISQENESNQSNTVVCQSSITQRGSSLHVYNV